jgi:hypothetical protein
MKPGKSQARIDATPAMSDASGHDPGGLIVGLVVLVAGVMVAKQVTDGGAAPRNAGDAGSESKL